MTATSTTALVPVQPAFSNAERLALAGFLAGYRGLTREAYTLDLRQFASWCRSRSLHNGIALPDWAVYGWFPFNRWGRDWPSLPVPAWPGGAR